MDSDLFMECEEEELEPWQQDDSTEATDCSSSASSTPVTAVEPQTVVIPNLTPVAKPLAQHPATVTTNVSKPIQGQPLILTQAGAKGLGTVTFPQVLLPGTSVASAAHSPQIFFTTQRLPVQNIQPGHSLLLNVQQGHAVRPITFLQAPKTQTFKPAIGATQYITQPAQVKITAPLANRTKTPSTFGQVQIPATVTIKTTAPIASSVATALPVPSVISPSSSQTTTKIITVTSGNKPLDIQNIMDIVKSVNLPVEKTFLVMSNQNSTIRPSVASPSVPFSPQTVFQTIHTAPSLPTSPITHMCVRCRARFKTTEALCSHMSVCSPQLTQALESSSIELGVGKTTIEPSSFNAAKNVSGESDLIKDTAPPRAEEEKKLVMLVDDFYYGKFEGNRSYVPTDSINEEKSFKCLTCKKRLKNNIGLMNHIKLHVGLEQDNKKDKMSCPHCFCSFPTPFRLQCHLESAHSEVESSAKCKICELSFVSETAFLLHMKVIHKAGEMPYVCQVCEYRSSFYSELYDHFVVWHNDTRHLLCPYCLKVFAHSSSYQHHYRRHQNSTVHHCNKCRLQFLYLKDKNLHKMTHHRTFRKPCELEGLQTGAKVTIRAYIGQKKRQLSPKASSQKSSQTLTDNGDQPSQQHEQEKKPVRKMFNILAKFQERRALLGRQKCVECTFDVPDFANHYYTYVHCSLCSYSTCCSRSYANHMINNHVTGRGPKASKKGPPCEINPPLEDVQRALETDAHVTSANSSIWRSAVKVSCAGCDYATALGNLMAKHLTKFPTHSHCTFSRKECLETDIEFCQVEYMEGSQGEKPRDVGTQPDWLSMDHWSEPREERTVPEFTSDCGPQISVARNGDVLDYFSLIFPQILFEQMVFETNGYASYCCSLGQGDHTWSPVTVDEVKGFFGLSILMGLQGSHEPERYWSWNQNLGRSGTRTWELFYRTMSVERFKQIRPYIRMGSMLVEKDKSSADKLAFFQPMLSILQTSMKKAYKPNKCLTIDQTFVDSYDKGLKSEKSTRSQPKIWLLCDSKSGYCHRFLVLTHQDKSKDLGMSVVQHLLEGIESCHHHIFLSNSLVSVPLMQRLYEERMFCSSSIPAHCPILPEELWNETGLENPGDYQQYECGPLLATRWKDQKQLVCLSTNAEAGKPDTVWRKSLVKVGELRSIERPLAFKLLQDNMRGVDICNQLLTCNQLGGLVLDTNWQQLFWFLVNLSIINSFILLREDRRNSPPAWFPNGHFSQAIYRKRLGEQLARSAERYARQNQVHNSAPPQQQQHSTTVKVKRGTTEEAIRHRLAKITHRTRKCRVCNQKNERHESMYGCTACLVNLCKRTRCFWDFHGFAPNYEGDPKVGFVENERDDTDYTSRFKTTSKAHKTNVSRPTSSSPDEIIDLELAPVEDEDTDLGSTTTESDSDIPLKTFNKEQEEGKVTKSPLSRSIKKHESLSVHQHRILLLALCTGIQSAAIELDTKPRLIKAWLRKKEERLKMSPESSSVDHSKAEENLVEWILTQREQQRPISEAKLFEKASEFQSQTADNKSFRISYEWAVGFLIQHKLGIDSPLSTNRKLPRSMEENCQSFTELAHGHIKAKNVQSCVIGSLGQLSIFVDFRRLNEATAFQFAGMGKPFVKMYFSIFPNGSMPHSMIFTHHPVGQMNKKLPDSRVILHYDKEGFTTQEELDLWVNQVWKAHLDGQNEPDALLITYSHHRTIAESCMAMPSNTRTFSAVVPVGCAGRHQPIEMCVRPVLQKFLASRWARHVASSRSKLQSEDLIKLLVTWVEEAMSCFTRRPELIQHSFCLAHMSTGEEAHTGLPSSPLMLQDMLSDITFRPVVVDLDSAEHEEASNACSADQAMEKIDLTLDSDMQVEQTGNGGTSEVLDLTSDSSPESEADLARYQLSGISESEVLQADLTFNS